MAEDILPGGWRLISPSLYEDASGNIDVEVEAENDTLEVGITDGDGFTDYFDIPLEIIRRLIRPEGAPPPARGPRQASSLRRRRNRTGSLREGGHRHVPHAR